MKKYFLFIVLNLIFFNSVFALKYEFKSMDDWNGWNLTHCDSLSNSGSVRILNITEDEFNTEPLNNKWKWDNGNRGDYDRGSYNFTRLSGYLSIFIWPPDSASQPLSEWWGSLDTAPKIYQQIDFKDNFQIETFTNIPSSPYNDYENHGLFIMQDSLDTINLTYSVGNSSPKISSFIMKQGENPNSVESNISYVPMYLMINKQGSTVITYYRTQTSDPWSTLQTCTNVNFKNCYTGLYLKDTSVKGAWADFDYFHYYGQKTFTAASLSKIIDLGIKPLTKGTVKWIPNIPNSDCHVFVSTQTSEDGINWTEQPTFYNESDHEGTPFLSVNRRFVKINVDLQTADYSVSPEIAYLSLEFPDTYGNSDTVIDDDHVKIYPTISRGKFTITYNPTKTLKSINFTVKDSGGLVVKNIDADPANTKTDLNLSAVNGVYFVFVTAKTDSGEEKKIIKKIVVKK
jgi:hypothetical protein